MCNEISWTWDPDLKTECMFLCTLFTWPGGMSPVLPCVAQDVRSGVEFSACGAMPALRRFRFENIPDLDLGLGMLTRDTVCTPLVSVGLLLGYFV